jgi:hypothetical protein
VACEAGYLLVIIIHHLLFVVIVIHCYCCCPLFFAVCYSMLFVIIAVVHHHFSALPWVCLPIAVILIIGISIIHCQGLCVSVGVVLLATL